VEITMATVPVYDMNKNRVGEIDLSDAVFNAEVKEYLIHEAIKIQLTNRRAGTVSVKNRAAVSGGGKKPYKQKGTGNARQGCIRAPHYPGGGVAFGPRPKEYDLAMNKKARKAALRSALSLLCRNERLTVLDTIQMETISTKAFASVLDRFDISKALIVTGTRNTNVELSARNIPNVKLTGPTNVTPYDLIRYDHLILTKDAVSQIEGALQP
jgi:large subunit ribosomal protein L4